MGYAQREPINQSLPSPAGWKTKKFMFFEKIPGDLAPAAGYVGKLFLKIGNLGGDLLLGSPSCWNWNPVLTESVRLFVANCLQFQTFSFSYEFVILGNTVCAPLFFGWTKHAVQFRTVNRTVSIYAAIDLDPTEVLYFFKQKQGPILSLIVGFIFIHVTPPSPL